MNCRFMLQTVQMIVRYLCFILFLLPISLSAQTEYGTPLTLNYYDFSGGHDKIITEEYRQFNDAELESHPEYGINPYNTQYVDCFEVLDKRTEDSRFFVKNNTNGDTFYVQKSYGPIHFKNEKGQWITIDTRLKPAIKGKIAFEAVNQPNPVRIDLRKKYTAISLQTNQFLRFEKPQMSFLNGKLTTTPATPSYTHFDAGNDGVIIYDFWPGIDRKQIALKGAVKTNYIVHSATSIDKNADWVLINEQVKIPKGYALIQSASGYYTADSLFVGDLLIVDNAGYEQGKIHTAKIFDAFPQNDFTNDVTGYKVRQQKSGYLLSIYVKTAWLLDEQREFPVTIDPLVSSSSTYLAGDIGFRPNANCFNPVNYCNYNLNVTVPGNSMLTNAVFSAQYTSLASGCGTGCLMSEAAFRIYGPCTSVYSPAAGFYTCPGPPNGNGNQPGVCSFSNISIFNNVSCSPISCPDHSLDFEIRTYHCSCATGSCATSCHVIPSGTWIITVEARTLEINTSILSNRDTICFGETVTLTSQASYGVPPYNWLWSYNNLNTPTISFIPDSTDTYYVTVGDVCGNKLLDSLFIVVMPNPVVSFTNIKPSCIGQNNGAATAVANTTPPYQYFWSTTPPQTTQTATGLPPGNYTVTVTDDFGCWNTNTVTISQPANALQITVGGSVIQCNGQNNGKAYVTINSGTPPYNISWNTTPVQTTDTIKNLSAGTYSVTVVDGVGCIANGSFTVTEPPAITLSVSADSASCYGVQDGRLIAQANGGTPPLGYLWNTSPPANTAIVNNVGGGNYNVTVTDGNGCTKSASVMVFQPNQINLNMSSSNANCGVNDGSASVQASGGRPPFTYLWNTTPPQTTSSISNLGPGTYTVTVTDNKGCTETGTVIIIQPGSMNVIINKTDARCNGQANGTASVTVTGGTPPFTYLWNTTPPSTGTSVSNLAAGAYSITVSDNAGCSQIVGFTISEPQPITGNATVQDVSCPNSSDGSATLNPAGGTPPYTYAWNTTPPQNTQTAVNLSAGNYTATITDQNLCTQTVSVTISAPAGMNLSFNKTDETCGGKRDGSATVNVNGGSPPFSYVWSSNPPQNGQTANNLPAGKYFVTVTDGNGCKQTDSVVIVIINVINVNAQVNDPTCNGDSDGSINVNPSGGVAPYTYAWSNGGTGSSVSGLAVGTYGVTVTDANGCNAVSNIVVNQPPSINVDAGTDQFISESQSTILNPSVSPPGSYVYSWSPPGSLSDPNIKNPVATPPATTVYTLIVTDANNCTGMDSVKITVLPVFDLTLPNAFTPNSDGKNDLFFTAQNVELVEIRIFNRWGEMVYAGTGPWDGTSNGIKQPADVYVYRALIRYPQTQTSIPVTGNVTLIR
jgi:gliding motility-associated-like protein